MLRCPFPHRPDLHQFRAGDPFRPNQDCRTCWVYHQRHGGDPAHPPDPPPEPAPGKRREPRSRPRPLPDLACVHRGEPTRTLEGCGCGAAPGVYQCALYGECVALSCQGRAGQAIAAAGLIVCEQCADRTGDPSPVGSE